MGAAGGSVYIREADQLVLKNSLDPGHAPPVIPMPLNANSVLGKVVEKGAAVLVSDAASSEGLMLSGWSGYQDESLLALPLVAEGNNIIGVLSLHTKQQPPFTLQDRDVGRILLAASSETLRAVKALEDLRELQSLQQMIMDSIPDCIRVVDRDGDLVHMNPAGMDFIEADSMDEIKDSICANKVIDSEYRDAFEHIIDNACKGEPGTLRCSMTGLRGTRRWIEVSAVPLRGRLQEIIGSLSVARDITDDKQLREKNRQQELQLMEANKMSALGTLVAGVAHEINNPNQTIQINSGLLRQVWEDTQKILDEYISMHGPVKLGGLQYSGVPGAHADLINDINNGAEQIKTVVDRLRSFSRPYDGIHGKIEGSQIRLKDAVETAIALLRHSIRKKTDSFHVNLQDNLSAIQGNRQQLQQVVINLVLNALEALPDRSHAIWVDTRLNAEQSCVELSVRDEGIGIKTEELDQVMEPFYTTRREQGGTGLGLSITHSLLQDLGGTIHFESEPGKGTLVVISLPVAGH
jgi:PAS domain S-box-containing protein